MIYQNEALANKHSFILVSTIIMSSQNDTIKQLKSGCKQNIILLIYYGAIQFEMALTLGSLVGYLTLSEK